MQQSCYRNEVTRIRGYVIGNSHDKAMDFLMYTQDIRSIEPEYVRIHRSVEEVNAGRWLNLIVNHPYFNGQFVLNYSNCTGFDDFDSIPSSFYAFARFFPLKKLWALGEVVMAVRVKLKANHIARCIEYDCYEINPSHIRDPFQLMEKGGFNINRVFIAELQAAENGWIVLKVHENPSEDDYCDELQYPFVPYNVSYLDETILPSILTRFQRHVRLDLKNQSKSSSSDGKSYSRSFETASEGPSLQKVEEKKTTFHSSTETFEPSSEVENDIPSSSSSSKPEYSNKTTSDEEKEAHFDDSTDSELENEVAQLSLNGTREVQLEKENDNFFDLEDLRETIGTAGLYEEQFLDHISEDLLKRLGNEQPMDVSNPIPVICIAVQKFNSFVLMFSPKKGVCNVLLDENKCERLGRKQTIEVGDVEFFEVAPRRPGTCDSLIGGVSFSHIALSKIEKNNELREKAASFQRNVRSYGNLLEVKIEVDLTSSKSIMPFYDEDRLHNKNEAERQFYFLKSTNNLVVSIPCQRLKHFLDSHFTAKFKIQTWATRKKTIGDVCLHIGPTTDVLCIYENGRKEYLPPLSDFYIMSGMMNKS